MEPIPETREAIDELDAYVDDGDLLEQLVDKASAAREIAPDCVGVSVATQEHGITFTLVATAEETAVLDGVQYLTSGPCVDAVDEEWETEGATTLQDLLSEPRWRTFGEASAAAGVRSTLTLPIVQGGRVIGSVNLYGGSADAFDGRHEQLAAVFGAWAQGAVTNADLSFSTRGVAERAPGQLREEARIDVATGIIAATSDTDVETARERLCEAAQRAGVSVLRLAELVIELRRR